MSPHVTSYGADGAPLTGGVSSRLVLGHQAPRRAASASTLPAVTTFAPSWQVYCVHKRPPPSLAPVSQSVPVTPRDSPPHRQAPTPETAAAPQPATAWADDAAAIAGIVNSVAAPAQN